MQKPLTKWITTNCRKILKRWEYQTTLPASWEICMQVKKQQLEPDMEWQTGSKLGKELSQGCILSPCLFNLYTEYIMRNARLDEAQAGIKIASRNINNVLCSWYHSNGRKQRGTKESPDEGKTWESKSWLKTQDSKTKIISSGPIAS